MNSLHSQLFDIVCIADLKQFPLHEEQAFNIHSQSLHHSHGGSGFYRDDHCKKVNVIA